jgi:hypothetical protein
MACGACEAAMTIGRRQFVITGAAAVSLTPRSGRAVDAEVQTQAGRLRGEHRGG